jgi:tetratricopeptide (TPR) repeat protein
VTDALEGIESTVERAARWIGEHAIAVTIAVVVVLAGGAGYEFMRSRAENREALASDALDRTQTAFLAAMGAEPGAIEVPELANPEAAKRIRGEYVQHFTAVAEAHPGTLPAALAWLSVADLHEALGDPQATLASLNQSLAQQPRNGRLAGLIHQRIAQLHEAQGRVAEAAAAYEAAGALADFPLRYHALVDAARCYAQTGAPDRALALLERVETEARDVYDLPASARVLLRELRAARDQASSVPDTSDKNDSVK